MSYEHSFTTNFYYSGCADSTRREDLTAKERRRPTCVYMAVLAMPRRQWNRMCKACFPTVPPDMVDADMVMDLVYETNTVSNLNSPVEVWIDAEGWHTVQVWDDA